jgi:hypothetical protein
MQPASMDMHAHKVMRIGTVRHVSCRVFAAGIAGFHVTYSVTAKR